MTLGSICPCRAAVLLLGCCCLMQPLLLLSLLCFASFHQKLHPPGSFWLQYHTWIMSTSTCSTSSQRPLELKLTSHCQCRSTWATPASAPWASLAAVLLISGPALGSMSMRHFHRQVLSLSSSTQAQLVFHPCAAVSAPVATPMEHCQYGLHTLPSQQ